MNILFAIKGLDKNSGGAERVLSVVASALAERGHKIDILSFDEVGGDAFYKLSFKISRLFLPIGKSDVKSGVISTVMRIFHLRSYIKRRRPDVVVGFMHSMFIPLSIALIGLRVPVVASEHIVPIHYQSRRLEYMLFLLSSFFLRKITVVSESIRLSYTKMLRKKMVVVSNPVHLDQVKSAVDRQDVILNVGRLDGQKDQACLIRAFAKIADHYPSWTLRIVGGGDLQSDLEALAKEKNIEARVVFVGVVKNVAEEYARARIFALSSIYESFGLVSLEAMSAGVPVIGFADCPGTNEVVQGGVNGLLIEDDGGARDEAMAGALSRLIEDRDLREKLGDAGRGSAREYSVSNVVDRWEEILSEYQPSI